MRVRITFEPDGQVVDRDEFSGLTTLASEALLSLLSLFGDEIEITQEEEDV